MIQPEAIRIECKCNTCGAEFVIVSSIGPSNICDPCAQKLIDIVMGRS
jgi:Zn finger protein HypA/HybF involved in hydrogenase expression